MKRFFNWRNKKTLIIILVVVVFISIIGISLASFAGAIFNNKDNSIYLKTIENGRITVSYDNTNGSIDMGSIDLDDATAGTVIPYLMKFQISSTERRDNKITIKWINVTNTFCRYASGLTCTNNPSDTYVADELTYQLYSCSENAYTSVTTSNVSTSCNKISNLTDQAVPASNSTDRLHTDRFLELDAQTTNYYVLMINLENLITSQNYHLDSRINVSINVERFEYPTLTEEILAAHPPVADNVASTYVTAATGIDFTNISSPTNGQGLYINSKANILNDPTAGTIKYFRGGTYCAYTNYTAEDTSGTQCVALGGTWATNRCSLSDSKETCEARGFNYYELKNNVMFGGYAWKIIRINEDGTFRLIYNGTTATSRGTNAQLGTIPYNTATQYDTGVGPGTASETNLAIEYASYDNGDLETTVNNFYSNLSAVSDKIVDKDFCSDTTWAETTSSSGWYFTGYYRVQLNMTPTYSCNAVGVYNQANGKLVNPIAVISGDEAVYAGSKVSVINFNHFLQSGNIYWTMTPSTWGPNNVLSFALAANGWLTRHSVYRADGVRPVINIKANVKVEDGDGSLSTPWEIINN